MSLGLYLAGFVIVIAGLVYGATLIHLSTHWIVGGAIIMRGFAILTGARATRQKDSGGS